MYWTSIYVNLPLALAYFQYISVIQILV